MRKKFFRVFIAIITAALFSGCSGDGMNGVFKYDISSNPKTLDPQQSNEANSDLIIANMFLGLFKRNADGSVSNGMCRDYSVSEDGLVYNFSLRDDIYWLADGFSKKCTAEDFVFGFSRLFSRETEAPRASDYFCIENSEAVLRGYISDKTKLGVKAAGEFELEIRLEKPNARFLALLCDAPAMPCCEEFFKNARGKYGLSAECTPSNGAFWLKSWYYDPYAKEDTDVNHLILGRNYKNAEALEICPSGINFFIEDKDEFVFDFQSGTTSCLAVSNAEKSRVGGKAVYEKYPSVTCGLIFNNDYELFRSTDFRKALCCLADREEIAEEISGGADAEYEPAYALVPRQVSVVGVNFREFAGDSAAPGYDVNKARELFEGVRARLPSKLFTGAVIIVPDDTALSAVSDVMQEWQREFGFYCVVEKLSEREYQRRLENGDFEIAAVNITGRFDSPAAYLGQFSALAVGNYSGYSNPYFDYALQTAGETFGADKTAEAYAKAEKLLLQDAGFLPLYYENAFFFTQKGIEDVFFDPFSQVIDFSKGKKK